MKEKVKKYDWSKAPDIKKYGRANRRQVKKLCKIADVIEELEPKYQAMSNQQLREMTDYFKAQLSEGKTTDDILCDAYAVCREAAKRVLNQRHYYVQLLGGIALHQGRICQMATGEGKTLTETLPAYLNALTGKGVHIVTVNEYLAARDAQWMGKLYNFLGITVGVNLAKLRPVEKQDVYSRDIVYGVNAEFGFDYLRDNGVGDKKDKVQRELSFAIIDEVDSILIDEARTPLIISAHAKQSGAMYNRANGFVRGLKPSTNVDNEGKLPWESGSGVQAMANRLSGNDEKEDYNGDYVVNWKDRNVRLTDRGIKKAEKYFGLENLSGSEYMTDEQQRLSLEWNNYINNALRANTLMKRDEDYIVENGAVVIVDPFTGRKMPDRRYSGGLHQALEAKEGVKLCDEDVTIATITIQNYFRLYRKISGMTGTAKTEEDEFNSIYNLDVVAIPTNKPVIRHDYEVIVYGKRNDKLDAIGEKVKECHEKGQPVLIGTVTVEKNEELSALLKRAGIKHNVLNAKEHQREAEIIAQAGSVGAVTLATNMAGRGTDILLGGNPAALATKRMRKEGYSEEQIELATGFTEETNPDILKLREIYNKYVSEYKTETDKQREEVIKLGGLFVIGTEMHESRRIDDQLRGRSGRQGDPGESVIYVSLEDDLIKNSSILAGLANAKMFESVFGLSLKAYTRVVTGAQKQRESMNFASRKHVVQYDDVVNVQRKSVYQLRNRILDGDNIHNDILEMVSGCARVVLGKACGENQRVDEWNIPQVNARVNVILRNTELQPILTEGQFTNVREAHKLICDYITEKLNERVDEGDETTITFAEMERKTLLGGLDYFWQNHGDEMDEMRKGIGLQAIAQKDPLAIYKQQAFDQFDKMMDAVQEATILSLLHRELPSAEVEQEVDLNPNKSLNRPCPCGSGKKYKNCCYKKDLAKQNISATPELARAEENRPLTKQEEYRLKREQRKLEKQNKK